MCKDVPLTHLTREDKKQKHSVFLTLECSHHFSQEKLSVLSLKT